MSHQNGTKQFLFIIVHDRISERDIYVLRGDHDPTTEEITAATKCDFRQDEGHQLHIERFSLDEITSLPPRKIQL